MTFAEAADDFRTAWRTVWIELQCTVRGCDMQLWKDWSPGQTTREWDPHCLRCGRHYAD